MSAPHAHHLFFAPQSHLLVPLCSDPEWRSGFVDTMSEPLERYARINDRLLDGCEGAYTAIADEFHADTPDWEQFVASGALGVASGRTVTAAQIATMDEQSE